MDSVMTWVPVWCYSALYSEAENVKDSPNDANISLEAKALRSQLGSLTANCP